MLYEKIIKTILANRGINTEEEITKFLNPSTNDFLNPFDLFGMHEACERINQSIINKEPDAFSGEYRQVPSWLHRQSCPRTELRG